MPQARPPEAQPTTAPLDKPAPAAPVAPTVGIPTIETDGMGSGSGNAGMAHDLSPWSMFLAADILVKAVIVSLIAASVLTWTILIGKTIELGLAKRRLSRDLEQASAATSLEEARGALNRRGGVFGGLIAAAEREIEVSAVASVDKAGIKERCESLFSERVRLETQGLRRGMGTLATIGAISPFVGLFGTVWGIMNAFIGISKSQTTNLAVVAPGIAEALLATAIGLAAAIPAVIIYNHFSQATRRQQFLVGRASGAVQRLLSRDLDRRAIIHANAAE